MRVSSAKRKRSKGNISSPRLTQHCGFANLHSDVASSSGYRTTGDSACARTCYRQIFFSPCDGKNAEIERLWLTLFLRSKTCHSVFVFCFDQGFRANEINDPQWQCSSPLLSIIICGVKRVLAFSGLSGHSLRFQLEVLHPREDDIFSFSGSWTDGFQNICFAGIWQDAGPDNPSSCMVGWTSQVAGAGGRPELLTHCCQDSVVLVAQFAWSTSMQAQVGNRFPL